MGDRERERVRVWERERERESVRDKESVGEKERECEREKESVREINREKSSIWKYFGAQPKAKFYTFFKNGFRVAGEGIFPIISYNH